MIFISSYLWLTFIHIFHRLLPATAEWLCVCLSVIMAKNVLLDTPIVPETTTEAVLNTWPDVNTSADRCCQRSSVTKVQDATTKLRRCVVEIRMQAVFKDGCGLSKSAGSGGLGGGGVGGLPVTHFYFKWAITACQQPNRCVMEQWNTWQVWREVSLANQIYLTSLKVENARVNNNVKEDTGTKITNMKQRKVHTHQLLFQHIGVSGTVVPETQI